MDPTAIPPPPSTSANELTDNGVLTVALTLVFSVLATLAVVGRFWARYLNAFKPVIEDWLLVGGLIFTWGYAAGNIVCKYIISR
jgi:hypothetical protein